MEYLIKPPSVENKSIGDVKPCQNEPCQLEKLELTSRFDRIEKHIAQLEQHRLYQIDENRKISRKLDDILNKFGMNESTLFDDH